MPGGELQEKLVEEKEGRKKKRRINLHERGS